MFYAPQVERLMGVRPATRETFMSPSLERRERRAACRLVGGAEGSLAQRRRQRQGRRWGRRRHGGHLTSLPGQVTTAASPS